MGFSLGGAISGAASWVGNTVSDAVDEGGKALKGAQDFVGDRLDDVDQAKEWVGGKIDGAVEGAEKAVDGFREDLVQFGEDHGGIVGKTLAENVSNTIGVVEGGTLAVYDMGKGVVQLADGASKLVNPLEWATHGDRNLQRLETTGKVVETLGNLTNPVAWASNPKGNIDTAKALWNGVTAGYQDAAKQGDWSKFIGRGVVDIGSLFIGVGEANAALKGAEGANALAKVGEGANALDKVAEGAKALDGLADGARAVDAAADAGKASKAADAAEIAAKIESVSTFKTLGLDNATAANYLQTASGKEMLNVMRAADPTADATTIYSRAMQTLSTGSTVPELRQVTSPLVKIVPEGQDVSAYSPFFATMDDVEAAAASGKSLADAFGLPIRSEAATYDIYQIAPKTPQSVFVHDVAPTSELDGAVLRSGGAPQYLVLNRSAWSEPVLLGSIAN